MLVIVEQLRDDIEHLNASSDLNHSIPFTCQVCIRTTRNCMTNDTQQPWHKHIHTSVTDPFNDLLAFQDVFPQEDEFHGHEGRFLREHVDESLNNTDCNDDAAEKARSILKIYHNRLVNEIRLLEFLSLANHEPVEIEIVTRISEPKDSHTLTSIHQLHWEVLENKRFIKPELRYYLTHITLRRRLIQEVQIGRRDDAEASRITDFNILVVIARRNIGAPVPKSDRWSPIQLLIALFKVQRDLWWRGGRQQINLEVVRPGTFEEFESQLARTRVERGQVHAVHFDVHGEVQNDHVAVLEFNRWDPQARKWVSDPIGCGPIATVLSSNHVPCLILGACKSAHSNRRTTANLSWQFVLEGTPNVVAMSCNMSDAMAYIFFSEFYRCLLIERQELGDAARIARLKLYKKRKRYSYISENSANLEDWFVPVVYTNGRRFWVEPDPHWWNWLKSRSSVRWCFAPQQWYIRAILCLLIFGCWVSAKTNTTANRTPICSFCRLYISIVASHPYWVLFHMLSSAVNWTGSDSDQAATKESGSQSFVHTYVRHWTHTNKVFFIIVVWTILEIRKTFLPWIDTKKFIKRALVMVKDKQNVLRIEGNLRRAKIVIVYHDVLPTEEANVTAKETLSTMFEIWKRTNCIDYVVTKRAAWLLSRYDSQSSLVRRLLCYTRLWASDIRRKHKEARGRHPRSVIVVEDLHDIRPADPELDLPHHQKSRKELTRWLSQHFAQQQHQQQISGHKTPYLVLTFLSNEAVYSAEDDDEARQVLRGMGVQLENTAFIRFTPLDDMNFFPADMFNETYSE